MHKFPKSKKEKEVEAYCRQISGENSYGKQVNILFYEDIEHKFIGLAIDENTASFNLSYLFEFGDYWKIFAFHEMGHLRGKNAYSKPYNRQNLTDARKEFNAQKWAINKADSLGRVQLSQQLKDFMDGWTKERYLKSKDIGEEHIQSYQMYIDARKLAVKEGIL